MNVSKWITKNAPAILSAIASIGVVATAIFAAKAVPKAQETMKEWTEEKHDELTKFEKVQASVKHYVPAAVSGAVTIGCIVASHKISEKQIAALAGAAAITTRAYNDYKRKNIELYGEDNHKQILKDLAVEKAKDAHITAEAGWMTTSLDVRTDEKKHLFYDAYTETYFESTMSNVLQAEYHLNRNMAQGADANVDMWCDFLGIERRSGGDLVGWVPNDDFVWIDFDHNVIQLEDGLECIEIDMVWAPQPGYEDWDCCESWPTQ